MSIYSGKCDCYDTLVMIHNYSDEELKNNVSIYIGDSKEPLHISSKKDLIPYYPFLISSAYFNGEERIADIHLTSESYVDISEKERFDLYLKWILKIYNRCKRKKVEFNVDEAVEEICPSRWDYDKDSIIELVKRVGADGKKASAQGLHLKMCEYYRNRLAETMLCNGLNPADYGYGRFI